MKKKIKPIRYIQPDGDKVKHRISESIPIEEEVKILRETLAKVLEKVNINDSKEFHDYNKLVTSIKTKIKS
jgi:hypothetical protein